MKRHRVLAVAVAVAAALGVSASAFGQKAAEREAVVTVTKVYPAERMVHVRAKTRQAELHLSPDVDMSAIQEGSRYKIRWSVATATAIEPGASAATSGPTRQAEVERKGPGAGVVTSKRSGVIESIDEGKRELTLKTLDGGMEEFMIGQGVSTESLKPGQAVTVSFQRALASDLRSTPQPVTDPAPPP
jgi:hypothetical protein